MKPVVAFTMGDPAGIGPEVAVVSVRESRVQRACRPLLIGSTAVFRRCGWRPGAAPILDPGVSCPAEAGRPTTAGGRASFEAVRLATDLARRGLVQGMVTAPISKRSWSAAGVAFRDHTDFLRAVTGVRRIAMLLLNDRLRSALATRHVALRLVALRLRERDVVDAAELLEQGMRALGVRRPRLGLCALNPHAGEHGLLGSEERKILLPSLRRLRREGMNITGPLPADAAWAAHGRGNFDALVALYHDQAMIPLKFATPYGIVNWTLGVPIIRTSPGHGTAFDIAGKRKANPEATIEAALLAAKLAVRGVSWIN